MAGLRFPYQRFTCDLTTARARLGAMMDQLILSRRGLSPPALCRFIPALSSPPTINFGEGKLHLVPRNELRGNLSIIKPLLLHYTSCNLKQLLK